MTKTTSTSIYSSSILSVLGFCAILFVIMSCLIKFKSRRRLSSKFKKKIRNANSNLDDIMESHWKEYSRLNNEDQASRFLAHHKPNIRSSVEIRTYSNFTTFLDKDKVRVLQTFESNILTKTTNKDLEESIEPTFCTFHKNEKEHFAEEPLVKDSKADVEKCIINHRIFFEVQRNLACESADPNSEQNDQLTITNSANIDTVTSLLQESEINHYYPMTHFRGSIDQSSAKDASVHSKCSHKRKPSDEDLYILPSTIIHSQQDHKRTL